MVDVLKYSGNDSRRVVHLSQAYESGPAQALIHAASIYHDNIIAEARSKPQISDDVKKDVRYKLGFAAGLMWVAMLPRAALKHINQLDEET